MGPNLSSQGRAVGGARRAHGTHARSYVVGCRACGRVGVLDGTLAPCRHPNGHAGVRSQRQVRRAYLRRMRERDYMNSVMSKTPPTAKMPMIVSGALVVIIAIVPPSKATTPTTAMVYRFT